MQHMLVINITILCVGVDTNIVFIIVIVLSVNWTCLVPVL